MIKRKFLEDIGKISMLIFELFLFMLFEKYFNCDNMMLQVKLLHFYYEMGSVSVLGLIL